MHIRKPFLKKFKTTLKSINHNDEVRERSQSYNTKLPQATINTSPPNGAKVAYFLSSSNATV